MSIYDLDKLGGVLHVPVAVLAFHPYASLLHAQKKKMIIMVVDFTIFPSPFLCVNLGRRWIGEADRHDFEGMLTRDIIQQAYGIPNFDAK